MTRADPYGVNPGVQGVDQGIELAQALRIFTLAGAEALYLEAETGSLAPGKEADFIVLDRQLFDIPPDQIGETRVLLTVLGARRYTAPRSLRPRRANCFTLGKNVLGRVKISLYCNNPFLPGNFYSDPNFAEDSFMSKCY